MNVVGKVGSLITQGVYSVATPFHPFGGAVDIIVVKQQNGDFRSTPWYVRFGKFQGVLKGAEKVVRIEVNGVEADFHMYLDNSGEAYFVREVSSGKENETNGSLKNPNSPEISREHTNFDDIENNDTEHERNSLGFGKIERSKSEGGASFYEFQEEQSSSLEGSVELSEYGSSRYENLDSVENMIEQDSNSEMVLVSVDGHILTAPISLSEGNSGNVELSTPQFHLGPGDEGSEFCEGDAGFRMDQPSNLQESIPNVASKAVFTNNGCNAISEDAGGLVKKEDGFKSCLDLSEFATQLPNADETETDSSLVIHENVEDSQETFCGKTEDRVGESRNIDVCSELRVEVEVSQKELLDTNRNCSDSNDQVLAEQIDIQQGDEGIQSGPQEPVSSDEHITGETLEPRTSSSGFEISLCKNLLGGGIGLSEAAEAFDAHRISEEEFKRSAASIIKNDNLVVRFREKYLTWDRAAPIVLGMVAFGLDLPIEPSDAIPVELDKTRKSGEEEPASISTTPSGRRWRLWPIPFRRVKTLEHTSSNASSEDVFVDFESSSQNQPVEQLSTPRGGDGDGDNESPHKQLIRTNIPTSGQIASLNLKEGQNMVTFIFSTRVLGMQKVEAHIYLWKWNARIVISDVDGTITKSDVLGQFMPLVGKDWTQSGVARLFCAIKENGYQLLFLSARAIVQAYLTRSFLLNLKQDGNTLPNGPVVISPDGLFPSLYREVIRRAPHEFKIACLEDIKALFPADYNPFYAGFGNRDTDELSYRKIGIPKGKIFIINPKGEVAINHRIDVKSYTSLHTLVNDMFPPTSLVEQLQEDYNSWNYWKMPLPDVDNL